MTHWSGGWQSAMEKPGDMVEHLFREEFSRMVAVTSRLLGLSHMAIAEDIVSETFLQAAESWEKKGMPPNPPAWLYAVAKQKTYYHFRRNKILEKKVIPAMSAAESMSEQAPDIDISPEYIQDSQLQMMFAVCNPAIASEAQIALALRVLCGFGIEEISEIFFSNKETINKRLFRAKEKLRSEKIAMELPPVTELAPRLDNVLHVIYLLFSEGYYSTTENRPLQKELCLEAMRLCQILVEYEKTNLPKTNALLALMCFHASRFEARELPEGEIVLYDQQDETRWDQGLISQGTRFLHESARGSEISSYHLEANIAYWHCLKQDSGEKWETILQLYNQLLQVNYSPSVALNRTYALYKANGAVVALQEAIKLNMQGNRFYHLLLAELYREVDAAPALAHYRRARELAKTDSERELIAKKIASLRVD